MLLKFLTDISPFRRLPVDEKESQSIESVSGETVALYFDDSDVLTADAGEAAGTAVIGQFKYGGIKSALGGALACYGDTSLSFTCAALTTEVRWDWDKMAQIDGVISAVDKLGIITSGFSNGQYTIDYECGTIYGVKATTATAMTSVGYKIAQGASGGSSVATTVDVTKIGGTAVNLDDAAFAVGVDAVLPTGFLADETATDSVGEGDTGIARMTLDRKQIGAGNYKDDTALVAGDYITPAGGVFDDASVDSVDEGDFGYFRMSANRNLYNNIRDAAGNERGANVTASNELNVIDSNTTDIPNVIGTDGAAGPTKCLSVAGTNAGNLQELEVTADGELHIYQDVAANLNCTEASASAIKTSVELIDDAVAAEASAATKGMQISLDDGTDSQFAQCDTNGNLKTVEQRNATAWNVTITSADASSATQIKAAGAGGTRHYITSLMLSTDTALSAQIQDDAGTPVVAIEQMYLAANTGFVYAIPPGSAIQMGTDAQDIDLLMSGAGNVSVVMTGYTI